MIMKKHITLVGSAVAAILGVTSAHAIAPNSTFAATLTVSGSSAFEGALESELSGSASSVCTSGTYNKFVSSTKDFRAYTCNAKAGIVTTTSTGGEAIAIYYRGEGGSVLGLAPLARSITPYRLNLASCPTTVTLGATATVTCSIANYDAVNDYTAVTPATGLETALSQLGFADEEPAMFIGENYPTPATYAFLQPALTTGEINSLTGTAQAIVAQSFNVYISSHTTANGASAEINELNNLTGLSKNTLSNIFRGAYADWTQVPADTASGFVLNPATYTNGLPIKLCRREAGSGTQVAASIFFNDVVLSGQAFSSEAVQGNLLEANGGGGVKENGSSGDERTCLKTLTSYPSASVQAGAIGFISAEADVTSAASAPGYKHLLIDGQGDTLATNANLSKLVADGHYDYWYELVAIKRPGLGAPASTIADKLIGVTQTQATGPTSPYVTYLPGLNTAAYPLVVPSSGKKYIGCLTRGKNSKNKASWQCT
jgi:hypothetical protein